MFWESRVELGSDPAVKQEAYLLRTERYFGGGSRNPVTTRKWQTDRLTTHTTTAGTVSLIHDRTQCHVGILSLRSRS